MEKITPAMLKEFRVDLNAAMKKLESKYGVTLQCGRGTYTHENFSIKVEGVLEGGLDKDAQRYEHYRSMYKLPKLLTVYTERGVKYRIIGLTSRDKVIVENQEGTTYTSSVEYIKSLVGK